MSTENNTGIQTRAMAQWVDNEANPEQLQRAVNPAMNPTVELHRTKEEAIEEFIRHHGTINLDWYVPDLCNTRVGNPIKKRLQLETIEGRILFSSLALSEFFKTSNKLRVKPQDRKSVHIPRPTRGHRYQMPEGTIRPGVSQRYSMRQTRYRHNTRRETRKNPKCKETSWTSRCNAQRRS